MTARRLQPPEERRPLTEDEKKVVEEIQAGLRPPPWLDETQKRTRRSKSRLDVAITGLQHARTEVEKQAGYVQDLIFNNWTKASVEEADDPRHWTQARELYEDYLEHGRAFGKKWKDRLAVRQVLATETQWGRWMATRYPLKKRRTAGWYYPLRVKGR